MRGFFKRYFTYGASNEIKYENNKQKYGTLIVRSKPSHAIVIVDNKNNMTPVFFNLENRDLPYDIIIKKEGYIDYKQKVVIQNGGKLEINAILKKKRDAKK